MNQLKRTILWVSISVSAVLQGIILTGIIFLNTSPQFGGSVSTNQQQAYHLTGHYSEGIFQNELPIDMEMSFSKVTEMTSAFLNAPSNTRPSKNIEVETYPIEQLGQIPDTNVRVTWLGHSSFLIEFEGKTILLDPVFAKHAAPHSLLGAARYNDLMPLDLEDIEHIDAVFISHDHYDHLDYTTINLIKDRTDHFFVPLAVDNHLTSWGISTAKISALDWWEEYNWKGLQLAFTPSRHMSGRGLTDQSATLWGSWVIKGKYKSIFFSGDGGYGPHFKRIGKTYGPFDVGLMECGQYNDLWAGVHMIPEETVQASVDVQASYIIPIHWGAFTLAVHSWTEPVERISEEARTRGVPLSTPKIGEPVTLGLPYPHEKWWVKFK